MNEEDDCFGYDPEKDPTGAIGHTLADGIFKSVGYTLERLRPERANNFQLNVEQKLRAKWEGITKIALARFYPTERGQGIRDSEIRAKLKKLNDAGYVVNPNYETMGREELWQYLERVKKDVREQARIYCPDILDTMNRTNAEIKRQEELSR